MSINIFKLSEEQQIKNFNILKTQLDKYIISDRKEDIQKFLNEEDDRLIMAAASPSDHGCYYGGLVEHMVDTIKISLVIRDVFKSLNNKNIPSKESTVFCAAFHDLGKLGTESNNNYEQENSDWHREKLGRNFNINKQHILLHHSDQGIYLLQHYNIKLTPEEFQAIRTHDGPGYIGNQWSSYIYGDSIHILTHITRISDLMASIFRRKEDLL